MKKATIAITLITLLLISALILGCTTGDKNFYKDKVAVLMYHHIDDVESSSTITTERFIDHLDTLAAKGYNIITLDTFRQFMDGKGEVPPNAVLLTFDDGYESFYNHAYPILKERDLTATVFMIVKNIGAKTNQIPKLDFDQMRELQEEGMSFHTHTYDNHYYQVINEKGQEKAALISRAYSNNQQETHEEYVERIYNDLKSSRDILEQELNTKVDFFSPPYGLKNQTVEEISKELGFNYLFTIKPGLADLKKDKMALPRINAGSPEINGEDLHKMLIKIK